MIWLIGLILLTFLFNEIQLNIEQKIKTTFDPTTLYWTNFFITFLLGSYIAILFIESWKLNLNLYLLILISIPCIFISVIYPIVPTLTNKQILLEFIHSTFFNRLYKISSTNIFNIIAGLTFTLSLFNKTKN